jgi:hypothetical protein
MLIHQANALLGRAGLLAVGPNNDDDDDDEGEGDDDRDGVPPLASLADLRAAAPALAVAVFEALLHVRVYMCCICVYVRDAHVCMCVWVGVNALLLLLQRDSGPLPSSCPRPNPHSRTLSHRQPPT